MAGFIRQPRRLTTPVFSALRMGERTAIALIQKVLICGCVVQI